MIWRGDPVLCLLALLLVFGVADPAWTANRRLFSYDPADAATRAAAGALTFEFDQRLISTHVLDIRATNGQATAVLKSVGQGALGRGGVAAVAGGGAPRDLYEILHDRQGGEMIQAFCPGASRAWLAIDRLRADHDLRVLVISRAGHAPPRLCRTLRFTYHGEWRLPPGDGVDPRSVSQPHFPY